MQKIILFALFVFFLGTRLYPQYPDLSKYTVANAGILVLEKGNTTHTEVPPWMIIPNSSLKEYFCTDGTNGYVCGNAYVNNFIKNSSLNVSGPVVVTTPLIASGYCPLKILVQNTPVLNGPTTGINRATISLTMNTGFSADGTAGNFYAEISNGLATGQDWRRNYYGVYTAQYYTDPVQDLGSNQAALFKKIEELTLYLIQKNKELEKQDKKLQEQKKAGRAEQSIANTKGKDNSVGKISGGESRRIES